MPLYTYRCNDCNHMFETRQRMSDDPLTNCPTCPGEVRRVINSVGVVFKGNGFYVTDSRNGRSANGSSNGVSGDKSIVDKSVTDKSDGDKSTATAAAGDKSNDKVENKSKAKSETTTTVQPAA
jgi:putative FmdB family regulatory protein